MKNDSLKNRLKGLNASFNHESVDNQDFEILKPGDANHLAGGTSGTCGALTTCGWNSSDCPKLTSCTWNSCNTNG